MDAAAPGMALGVVIGRIGDLIVADHLGKETDFFLGYECPSPGVDTASPCNGEVVFQPALIDLLSTAVLLVFLLRLRRKPRWDGFLIMVFAVWYGVARIVEDFMRIDETHGTGLTGSQWTSVVVVLVCGAWLLLRRRTPGWGRWDEVPHDVADQVGDRAGDEDAGEPSGSPDEPPTMASRPEREE